MNPEPPRQSQVRFWRAAMFVALGFALVPPMLGLSGTVYGMVVGFRELDAAAQNSLRDPASLSRDISQSLVATVIGLVAGAIGLVAFLVCLVRYLNLKNRTQPVPS